MVAKIAKYIGSQIAKRVLKNRPDLHKKFDDIMKNDVDVTMTTESQARQALSILRENEKGLSGLTKKSKGGLQFKGSDYYKDLL